MDSSGKPSTAQIVVLATSSALTAFFYSIYRSRATIVARLKVRHISAFLCLSYAGWKFLTFLVYIYFYSTGSKESLPWPRFENHPVWNSWKMYPICRHRRFAEPCGKPKWSNFYFYWESWKIIDTYLLHTAGVVRSVKETLNSQFVDNCKGVIERLTLKEEKMVWNRTTHIW